MTHMKRNFLPTGERALTPPIAGQFPGGRPFMPLPCGCQADFVTWTSIAEIEPVLRWQTGLSQALEYWSLCLQSLHPILILLRTPGTAANRAWRRAETTCAPLPLQLWLYDPAQNRWEKGGPTHHYASPPEGPMFTARGEIWHAPDFLLRAYQNARVPFATWRETYQRRQAQGTLIA